MSFGVFPLLSLLLVEIVSLDFPCPILHLQEDVELTIEEVIDNSDKIELSRVLNPSSQGKNGSSSLFVSSFSQDVDVMEFVFACLYRSLHILSSLFSLLINCS